MTANSAAPATARAAIKKRRSSSPRRLILGVAGIITFLLAWEIAPRVGLLPARYLPPASEVLAVFAQDLGMASLWKAVGDTMLAWVIGLSIAVVAATVIGLVVGMSPFLRKFTNSTVEFLRPIPSVALIPLAVLLFGVKLESSLMLIIYASFWQVLIQTLYGVADVDNVAMNTAKSYGFSYIQRVRDVVFPTVWPFLMTGIRLAAAVALILAITAQLVIGSPGLGNEISRAQSGGAIAGMYALILATGLLGVLINMVMRFIEKKTLGWHPSVRGEVVV
ncbi:ABC-type nitrate/sulfonate/bicarbonate transport system permease component [Neomicrococcus aestuarii]|uniref:ABC-type nitrate/sulfonate/bicarbonate transport system permease component n=1 Tax=Neomicrococcus aestuarii TaxID=556325 RepID=A0A7W8TUU3_9MICC|nr:ABC transporter permease [Neomicrococcus aestuarii]MBB5513188.1 ABC-type nitrate/sulfonate/bicarbonate transport system permease component [Neomicrococcus aestuarii]